MAEITARVYGHATDAIHLMDEMTLGGRNARGLSKTRVAVEDNATSEVIGITHGKAEGARGHMDCTELVRDRAVAKAEPIVNVEHPLAKVTHEAAIGSVDQKQLETLMAHGCVCCPNGRRAPHLDRYSCGRLTPISTRTSEGTS